MKFLYIFLVAFASFYLGSCTKSNPTVNTATPPDTIKKVTDTTSYPTYQKPFVNDSNFFSSGVNLGSIDSKTLKEASGIAASRKYPNFFWTHNDSGNPNDVYLLDSTGKIRAIVVVTNSSNVDWEDIAVGPGPVAGISYVYVGDIGDNSEGRYGVIVYRFPEPDLTVADSVIHISGTNTSRIFLKYPNGAHNAETLMIDPLTKDLYIASKNAITFLYLAEYPQTTDSLYTMKEIAVLPLSTLTAGDISGAGDEILMKNYSEVYYWKRLPGEKIITTLNRTPALVPYTIEAQGEAICWSITGDAYYTTSEFTNNIIAGLWKYKRK
jgi:hypothetical protein